MAMSISEAFIKELLEGADQEKLASFVKTLPVAPPVRTKYEKKQDALRASGPVKTFSTIVKQYTCLACDSHFSVQHSMVKGDQTTLINKDGSLCVVTSTGKEGTVTLASYCSVCHLCKEKVQTWPREELERRWLALVASSSYQEKRVYNQSIMRHIEEGKV